MAAYRWLDLEAHPSSQVADIERVRFGYLLRAEAWKFMFEVYGDIEQLEIPVMHLLERGDELWKKTCFELFIGSDSRRYREINIAPDGHVAAYDFASYRADRSTHRDLLVADVDSWCDNKRYSIEIELTESARLGSACHLGPAAIVFDKQGRQSWWALDHKKADAPDFHHPPSWRIAIT